MFVPNRGKKISVLPRAELSRMALVTGRNLSPVIAEKPNIAGVRAGIDFKLRY